MPSAHGPRASLGHGGSRNGSWDLLAGIRKFEHSYEEFDTRNASQAHLAFADGDTPKNTFMRVYTYLINVSIVSRWILFVIPVLAILWIPGVLGITKFPNSEVWGVKLVWWSVWLSVIWVGWWAALAFSMILPHIGRYTLGVVAVASRRYIDWLEALHRYIAILGWMFAVWVSYQPLINTRQSSTASADSVKIIDLIAKLLFAFWLCACLLVFEKFAIQWIAGKFHERSYAERIAAQKFAVRVLVTLYRHSSDIPGRTDTMRDGHHGDKRMTMNPRRFLRKALKGVRMAATTTTTALGNVASEIAGSSVLQPNSPQAMVQTALESANKSRLLARRLFYSFARPGAEYLIVEDIARFFATPEEADAAFAIFDKDSNGDASRDELEMACMEAHREQLSIENSMRDLDSAVGRLDNILMSVYVIVALLIIAVALEAQLATLITGAGTLILGLSWLVGDTLTEVLTSIIFLFVKHPYDVGDRVTVLSNTYTVKEIRLLSTIFLDANACLVQAPNTVMNQNFIYNMRRSPQMSESFTFDVAYATSFDQIEDLRGLMLAFLENDRRDYQAVFDVVVVDIPGQEKMTLRVDIKYKSNWQQGALKAKRRNKWICALKTSLAKVKMFGPEGDPDAKPAPAPYTLIPYDEVKKERAYAPPSPSMPTPLPSQSLQERTIPVGYTFSDPNAVMRVITVAGGLYPVHHPGTTEFAGRTKAEHVTINELHRLLGHISHESARSLVKKGLVTGVILDESEAVVECASCRFAKATRKAIQREREGEQAKAVGNEIHSDVWGPAPVQTIGGRRYYISFTDDHSRYTVAYLMRTKDEAFTWYKTFAAFLKTQKGVTIKTFHTDRGVEFLSKEFNTYLESEGTVRHLTVHDTPEYNGAAERLNLTLLAKVRAMIQDSSLPKFLWGEALMHSVYLKNCSPTRALENATPLEVFTGAKPDLSKLHVWGSKVYVHTTAGSKLDARAQVGHWVGFDVESRAHRVYWAGKRSITVERSVVFADEPAPVVVQLEGEVSDDPEGLVEPSATEEHADAPLDVPTPSPSTTTPDTTPSAILTSDVLGADFEMPAEGRSRRVRKESDYIRRLRAGEGTADGRAHGRVLPQGVQAGVPMVERVEEVEEKDSLGEDMGGSAMDEWEMVEVEEVALAAAMGDAEGLEPTLAEARKRPDWPKWQAAIGAEIENLVANNTWTVVERPPDDVNVVDSKIVLRVKKNAAGEIDKYKARLVARGFTQVHGVDYFETFAPVAKLSSFRLLLAIAARNNWDIKSFDFSSAYLNSPLDEDVYMEQPRGFESADRQKYVLKLAKALYGLKQGGRKWYETLCATLADLGFRRAESDFGVFFKVCGDDLIVMAVHVDDCALTGSSTRLLDEHLERIKQRYRLTSNDALDWLLGIKVVRDRQASTLALSQHAYIDSIISRYNFNDLKPISIPMDPHTPLSRTQCPVSATDIARMAKIPYREAIGSLMYAAIGTRPDIAFAVSTLAQFSDNPAWIHWE
ncbi:hypothetical protein EUX98_g8949, partial [Antrodiella citrinella]